MAGLLNQNPYGGGLLGNPLQAGLLGQNALTNTYSQPNNVDRFLGGLTRLPFAIAEGIGNRVMQAHEAMPWGGNNPAAIGYDPQAGTIDPSVMVPFATDVAGMATTGSLAAPAVRNATGMGIRAYHGSPHDFDRFSMDKIGTGEGAQAYGHGLYFAESPAVAKQYKENLSTYKLIQDYNNANPRNRPGQVAQWWTSGMDLDRIDEALRVLEPDSTQAARDEWIRQGQKLHDDMASQGRMYEVDIDASPDELIDYDADWSGQPDVVKRHFAHLAKNGDGPRGSDLAARIESQVWLEEARNAGIKGIRYKDAGSRATSGGELLGVDRTSDGWKAKVRVTNRSGVGIQSPADMVTTSKAFPTEAEARQWAESKIGGGTSNYVVFDDKNINILKKYGIAGLMAGGAGAAALGSGTQDASAAPASYSTGGRF